MKTNDYISRENFQYLVDETLTVYDGFISPLVVIIFQQLMHNMFINIPSIFDYLIISDIDVESNEMAIDIYKDLSNISTNILIEIKENGMINITKFVNEISEYGDLSDQLETSFYDGLCIKESINILSKTFK